MSVRIVIDSLNFVRDAGVRHGKISLIEFKRLHDLLFDQNGELTFQVTGQLDKNNKPGLNLEIQGYMQLTCQRCLGKILHCVDVNTFLLLAKSEKELNQADEDDTLDVILAAPDLDIIDLIEDEIILSLPISVRHAEGECSSPASSKNIISDKTNTLHPFATLVLLKKHEPKE